MSEQDMTSWVHDRSRLRATASNAILHLHPARVPAGALRFTYTWGLGGISAMLAVLLGITGLLLMFRYDANIERAYTSILFIETEGAFGSLVRGVHHWSANLLVIAAFLHLVRVFLTGGFKRGRTMNWLIGIALLVLVLASNFTGYLLPWDQLAYWAVTVSTSLIEYIPRVGTMLSNFVLAGSAVGQGTLRNFYAVHVAVLPVILLALMGYHFWKVRKNGGISQPYPKPEKPITRVSTIPNLVRIEFAAATVVIVGVLLFSMFNPAPLNELADPVNSPNPAKAAWYFLGLQELLLHMDALAAIGLVGIVLLGLVFLPRWDSHDEDIGIYFRSRKGRWAAFIGAFLAIDLIPMLVVADEYWIDLPTMLPGEWPVLVVNGLVPLLATLGGLALIYLLTRLILRANRSEALVGVFVFVMLSLVVLTFIGVYFRGPNMALVLPF
jgi:quinol-cytochrome oxidoreductase complex cytochrome b subunit